jgi:hypothetical protein
MFAFDVCAAQDAAVCFLQFGVSGLHPAAVSSAQGDFYGRQNEGRMTFPMVWCATCSLNSH